MVESGLPVHGFDQNPHAGACSGRRVNDAHLVVDQLDHSDAGKVLDERLADGGVRPSKLRKHCELIGGTDQLLAETRIGRMSRVVNDHELGA